MLIRIKESYKVADGPVKLSVHSGDGQPADISVRVGGKLVAEGHDKLEDVPLGDGADLRGVEVRVIVVVTDTNTNHNRTNVGFRFTGGERDESFAASYEFDRPDNTARYAARFELY